ncbi:choice-of-anchor R domain-containing protein [Chloroflexota bacterium]
MDMVKWCRKPINVLLTLVLVLSFSLALAVPAQAFIDLYEHHNTGDNQDTEMYQTVCYAQTFTAESNHNVTSVRLKLYRIGNPGTVIVSIRATDGSGHSTGPDLTSGTTDGNTLTDVSPGEWRQIPLAGYPLLSGTKYAIVVRISGGDVDNHIRWRWEQHALPVTSPYTGGNAEMGSNYGASWVKAGFASFDRDFMFEVFEWGAPPTPIVTWNTPIAGVTLIAPNPGLGRPFLTVAVDPAEITVSAGAALWGIYYLDETVPGGEWLYNIPGFVSSTLTMLEPSKYYYVVVSSPCTLTIPQETPPLVPCLASGTIIGAPDGPVPVEQLHEGMMVWTMDESGKSVAVAVIETSKTPVPSTHQVVSVELSDGRKITASLGHPTAEGKALGDYRVGDNLDGTMIVNIDFMTYKSNATYDILPDGATGLYWANGVLLQSTITAR